MKYVMTVEVEAEQFLPDEDKIPAGVVSDGPRNPKNDPRASWIVPTIDGAVYLRDKDYVITNVDGTRYVMKPESFETMYKPLEG